MGSVDNFEEDDNKAASNFIKRGIEFDQAIEAFRDLFAVERIDSRFDYGEERYNMLDSDPDAVPMTKEEWEAAPRVSHIKTLRRALRLTQEEFSLRYRIPLGTLRDWEQGRSEPDQTARAYLKVIAADPEIVQRLLQVKPHQV